MCNDMRSTPIQLNHGVILSLQSRVTITFRTTTWKFLEIKSATHQMKSMSSLIRFYVYIMDTSLWRRKER